MKENRPAKISAIIQGGDKTALSRVTDKIIQPPEDDYYAVIGSTVVISCRTQDLGYLLYQLARLDMVQETELLFTYPPPEVTAEFEKYEVHGAFDLHIKNITPASSGHYGCKLGNEVKWHRGEVTVVEKPRLYLPDMRENKEVQISCFTSYYPVLEYLAGRTTFLFVQLRANNQSSDETMKTRSYSMNTGHYMNHGYMEAKISLTPTLANQDDVISCDVYTKDEHGNVTMLASESSSLDIGFSPRDIEISPRKTRYHVGDDVTCDARGNPRPSVQWTPIKSPRAVYTKGKRLVIQQSMVGYNKLACRCSNRLGTVSAIIEFNVCDDCRGDNVVGRHFPCSGRSVKNIVVLTVVKVSV